jgi:hypothetical protein
MRGEGRAFRFVHQSDLDVLGNVDQHRPRSPGGRDTKRFFDGRSQLGGIVHQIIVLGAVPRDADRVGLLKRIGPDQTSGHLPGDDHHRDRIHPRIGDTGHRIGRTGAAGDEDDARLAGGAGIAFRRMRRAGFVPHEDMAQAAFALIFAEQLVIDRQHRAAGIAEYEFDALLHQRIDQDSRATALLRHGNLLHWLGLRETESKSARCGGLAHRADLTETWFLEATMSTLVLK